jgi:hypothetical protein
MGYLIIIFIIIILIGIVGNRELARDSKRIQRMMREYSFRSYPREDTDKKHQGKEKTS